jgi:peptide/nickel transport system substrate-binding protein
MSLLAGNLTTGCDKPITQRNRRGENTMKVFKRFGIILTAIIFWGLVAGQAGAAKNDTLIWAISTKIPTMDIYATTSLNLTNIYHMVSDSLVERDIDDLSIKPGLARSWKRLDDTTWEFALQPGVTYHNGNPLTSEAVRFTIMDWILNPEMKSKLRSAYTFIKDVEVIDDLHFRVHTTGPYPLILERFCTFFPYDPEFGRKNQGQEVAQFAMGTGPYKMVKWDKGSQLMLTANDSYWVDGLPKIKNITIRVIPEQSTRIAELISGNVHLISKLDPDKVTLVEKNARTKVLETPSHRINFWQFDTLGRAGKSPVQDKRIRQAIWHAIDRQAIIDNMFQGHAEIINSPLSPFDFGYTPDLKGLEFNPEKARQLLKEAGYENGFEMEVMYYYPIQHQFNSAAMGFLKKVGITLLLKDFRGNIGQAIEVRDGGKTKDVGNFGWASYMLLDADGTLPIWFGEGSRNDYTGDAELAAWIEEARYSFDQEHRRALYEKAQQRIIENVYWMPISTVNTIYGAAKNLQLKLPINETLLLKIAHWDM